MTSQINIEGVKKIADTFTRFARPRFGIEVSRRLRGG